MIFYGIIETSSQVVVGAGLYILDVIDTNGCTASSSINIIEPDSFYVIGSLIPTCNQMGFLPQFQHMEEQIQLHFYGVTEIQILLRLVLMGVTIGLSPQTRVVILQSMNLL